MSVIMLRPLLCKYGSAAVYSLTSIIHMLYILVLLVADETASELASDDKSSKQNLESKRSTLSASSKEQSVEFHCAVY